jgi:hypothetical protein
MIVIQRIREKRSAAIDKAIARARRKIERELKRQSQGGSEGRPTIDSD